MNFKNIYESVIDLPQSNGLEPNIWKKNINGQYELQPNVRIIIEQIIEWVESTFDILKNSKVHIVGSICSNQYSNDSDIDIHFCPINPTEIIDYDEFNVNFRQLFKQHFNNIIIHNYYVELYCQKNKFQDYMSVGCYDVKSNIWEVEPTILPLSYDPYDKYYNKSQDHIKTIITDIRQKIFKCYELASILRDTTSYKFEQELTNRLIKNFKYLEILFKNIKTTRSSLSEPISKEDALKKRQNDQWKVSDVAYKLLNKFGYLAIINQYKNLLSNINDYSNKELAQQVINIFNENILTEKELFEGKVFDNMKDISKKLLIATFLSIPSILPAKDLEKNIKDIPVAEFNIQSQKVRDAIVKSSKQLNNVATAFVINAVTRTLYYEGRGESNKGIHAIASVIWNRAGKKPENLMSIISATSQFSCWDSYDDGWDNDTYRPNTPYKDFKNKTNKEKWYYAESLAIKMINKEFKSSIGDLNCYMNKQKASKKAKKEWGHLCTKKIGNHHFGYQKLYDGELKNLKKSDYKTYTVKNGDTLSTISAKLNISIDRLKGINKIKNVNNIKIGQKILYI